MNCLDCRYQLERDVTAVAICLGCGSGVCPDHSVLRLRQPEPTHLRLGAVALMPGARDLRCLSCDAAAHAQPPAPGRRLWKRAGRQEAVEHAARPLRAGDPWARHGHLRPT